MTEFLEDVRWFVMMVLSHGVVYYMLCHKSRHSIPAVLLCLLGGAACAGDLDVPFPDLPWNSPPQEVATPWSGYWAGQLDGREVVFGPAGRTAWKFDDYYIDSRTGAFVGYDNDQWWDQRMELKRQRRRAMR
jgi:hypothetical protein